MHTMPMPASQTASAPLNSTASDTSKLCLDCGLCCLGAFFSKVGITEEELQQAPVLSNGQKGQTHFPEPCTQFKEGCCSIYEDRPQICSNYRCQLYKDVQVGQVPLGAAQATVNITQQQVTFLLNALQAAGMYPPDTTIIWPPQQHNLRTGISEFYRQMKGKVAEAQPVISEQEIALCYAIFDYYKGVNTHFRSSSLLNKFAKIINTIELDKHR